MFERRKRTKGSLVAVAVTALVVSVTAVALAHDDGGGGQPAPSADPAQSADSDVPEGPYVDFCPTLEQTEAHLKQYGFDYKPTVFCGSEDGGGGTTTGSDWDDLPASEREERENALLKSAEPAPDKDGDPTTIEGTLPDGRPIVISVSTSTPEKFEGMTPAEYVETQYEKK